MARRKRFDPTWFEQWRDPEEFLQRAKASDEALGEFALLTRAGLNDLKEARTAGQFARLFASGNPGTMVRLRHPLEPDFQLCVDDEPMSFESVEVDRKERRRGEEYKKLEADPEKRGMRHMDESELHADHQAFKVELQRALRKKATKKYLSEDGKPITPNLLVRVNLDHDFTPADCAQLTKAWKDVFRSIWLLEPDGRIVQVWPGVCEIGG